MDGVRTEIYVSTYFVTGMEIHRVPDLVTTGLLYFTRDMYLNLKVHLCKIFYFSFLL